MTSSIQISNLKFSYSSQKNILDISSLQISEGEKVFIYGPSGYGKSTLLNIISGVLSYETGTVNVLGRDLNKISKSSRDKLRGSEIGYIFQIFNLIPYLNLKENIILPCLINKERSEHANFHDHADELISKLGLQGHLDRNVTDLSIGQQQRVAQARALIGNPKLLIADEPTSSLDEKNTTEFMNLLMSEWEKRKFTLVFVSHDERLKKYFDRTISLPEINKAI
ncbi:MAG: ABC transporter ATP-binding protein [Bacteriovorax sp.]|nr:ABC transporter ATP-binding protein [Bacteriovorax sp.]